MLHPTNNINSITLAPTILSQDELAHFALDDPLILALSMNRQAHTVINDGHFIFGLNEDVPVEFQTVDTYVSDDY
jgi:hypothetical protein